MGPELDHCPFRTFHRVQECPYRSHWCPPGLYQSVPLPPSSVSLLYIVLAKLTFSGADDDGSGTTSSLEGLKALAHANFTPSLPVEFHYFSAEEGGLLGSQAIAKSYEEEGRKVLAMLQMDMTAWVKKGTEERVGIIQDFVDPALTSFIEELIAEYRMSSHSLLNILS